MSIAEKAAQLGAHEDADKTAPSRLYIRGIITQNERKAATNRAIKLWEKSANEDGLKRAQTSPSENKKTGQ
ncbi:MAG: hypothetical protein JKY17_06515 [Magnetovibrio sp.]|nr:hypothetical protein [Magnetovibrio sp.]